MLERNILIIDDNLNVEKIYIPKYSKQIEKLKQAFPKWNDYMFCLKHCSSMKAALEYLSVPTNYVDVLVVDYDFNGETTFSDGTAFVEHVRKNVNRYCQIIFYSMQGMSSIDVNEWAKLVNSDVFRFVDKSAKDDLLAETIFEAATKRNPIVESLERFWSKYSTMLESYSYTFDGQSVTFEEIINHIRMDDEIGRVFVEKLLHKSILTNIEI